MAARPFAQWPFWRRLFGQRSERTAAVYLRRRGYRILATNVTIGGHELDIVALSRARVVVFVEVRSRTGADTTPAVESVDTAKQRAILTAALAYLKKHRLLNTPHRFDILALAWPVGADRPTIVHIEQAFTSPQRWQWHT